MSTNNKSAIMKNNIFNNLNENIQIIDQLIIDKNCVYYILKHISYNDMNILQILKTKTMNNYLIYEPLDINWRECNILTYLEKMRNKLKYFNHVICNNNNIVEYYKQIFPNMKYTVLYHEYDMRFKPNNSYDDHSKVNMYYIGCLSKCSLTENICAKYNINVIQLLNNTNFINTDYTGIHIDYVKKTKIYYYLHTSTKLATAMCFNSIFICNKIPVYTELLGHDYEFYVDDNLSNLQKIIDKATEYITTQKPYNNYIQNMKKIREKLSHTSVREEYNNLFNSIK